MALKAGRQIIVMLGVLVFLATPCAIYSCGPFLSSAIFAFEDRPADAEDFAAGRLGIVRPGYKRSYLVVAYRYFSGLKLTATRQKAAIAVWNKDVVPEHPAEDEAAAAWSKARSGVPSVPPEPEITPYAVVSKDQPYFKYVNCPGDAFQTAVRTLGERSAKWGATSDGLREWVAGQDQVFANCGAEAHVIPAALREGDALLRADRAYQVAAAHFYARDFDAAAAEFDAIAKDGSSPWAEISAYLAARALIRKANLVHAQNEEFDRATLMEAQKRLESVVADPKAGALHDPAKKLLNFVMFRTDPQKRVAELDAEMLKADPGGNFKQDLWDYALLLSEGKLVGDPGDWVVTFGALQGFPLTQPAAQGQPVVEEAARHSLERWRATKAMPWLVAALAGAKPGAAETAELLGAAKGVPRTSAGYLTVRYIALRLMVGSGQAEAARKELDGLLADKTIALGAHNLLNDVRQQLTTSLDDFLAHAAEAPVPSELDFNTAETIPADSDENQPGEPLFNHYAAEVFVKRMPLAMLVEAAENPALPPHLRREVARTAWVRAILLNNLEAANQLQNVLKEVDRPLWTSMEGFRAAAGADQKHFAALVVILNNPGLKPSVRESSPRAVTLAEIDNYRDNWWCEDMAGGTNWGQTYSEYDEDTSKKRVERDPQLPFPAWVSGKDKEAASAEWTKLGEIGTAPNYLAKQALAYAKEHVGDARVPQALHLVVRSTRYGCINAKTSQLSKASFDFLHERYPQNEWTARTKYYY